MKLLLNIFEQFLDQAPDSSAHDIIRQSVIILTGSLAKHLSKTDPKVSRPHFTNNFSTWKKMLHSQLPWKKPYSENVFTVSSHFVYLDQTNLRKTDGCTFNSFTTGI